MMKQPTITPTKQRFSLIVIDRNGSHGWSTAQTMAEVNARLDAWAKQGDMVTAVIVGPSALGPGATTAIASLVESYGSRISTGEKRFEVLQPVDRKQIQLWYLEDAKGRDAGTVPPTPAGGTRRKRALSGAERDRLEAATVARDTSTPGGAADLPEASSGAGKRRPATTGKATGKPTICGRTVFRGDRHPTTVCALPVDHSGMCRAQEDLR